MNLTKKHVGRWVVDIAPKRAADCFRTEGEAVHNTRGFSVGVVFAVTKHAKGYGLLIGYPHGKTFGTQQAALRHATVDETAWQIVAVYEVVRTAKKIGGAA